MAIVIQDFEIEATPSAPSTGDPARGNAEAQPPSPAWTAPFAQRLQAELVLAAERAARLQAD